MCKFSVSAKEVYHMSSLDCIFNTLHWIEFKLQCIAVSYLKDISWLYVMVFPNCHHLFVHFRRYGFQSYLRDYIVCEEGVMRYLCAQYHVHNVPVGNRRTKECVEDIKDHCPELTRFYTDEYQVRPNKKIPLVSGFPTDPNFYPRP